MRDLEEGLASAEVDIGRGQVIDALVIALGVVVVDEVVDLGLQGARQLVVCPASGPMGQIEGVV